MERPDQSLTIEQVVCLLHGYLCANPDASDTAEGIAQWWFRAHGINVHEATVEVALKELVTSGWLIAVESRGGQRLYALNSARRSELQRHLPSF